MTLEQKHPAEELGKALARASGILSLLSGCYEKSTNSFETENTFVFESIIAVEAMLSTATNALETLYENCDLTLVKEQQEEATPEVAVQENQQPAPQVSYSQPAVELRAPTHAAQSSVYQAPVYQAPVHQGTAPQTHTFQAPISNSPSLPYGSSYLGFFGPAEPVSTLSDKIDNILVNMPSRPRAKHVEIFDKPAETYDELLQKLTALADVAAFQAHQANTEASLGPALEELRADLIKLRSVA